MTITEMLRDGRVGMIDIGRSLSDDESSMRVLGCPEWTIKDVYAHQAGVVADAIAGRLEGVTTDPWTARQVDERRRHTLAEVLDEWEASAPTFEGFFENGGPPEAVADQWTHEQDVRGTLDRPGNCDDARARFILDVMTSRLASSWTRDATKIVGDRETWQFGEGDPKLTLRVPDYDLARLLFGRRSRAQVLAMDWDGDPEAVVDGLVIFSWSTDDLAE